MNSKKVNKLRKQDKTILHSLIGKTLIVLLSVFFVIFFALTAYNLYLLSDYGLAKDAKSDMEYIAEQFSNYYDENGRFPDFVVLKANDIANEKKYTNHSSSDISKFVRIFSPKYFYLVSLEDENKKEYVEKYEKGKERTYPSYVCRGRVFVGQTDPLGELNIVAHDKGSIHINKCD